MSQLFTLYYPKWYFELQKEFSLTFESSLPFKFLIAQNGNVYVDQMNWSHLHYDQADFEVFRSSGLQNGLNIISINGEKIHNIDLVNQHTLEFMIEKITDNGEPITIVFKEGVDPIDNSPAIGLAHSDDQKQDKIIQDYQISASSFQKGYEPSQCRLNNPNSCWKPLINDRSQWVMVDLEEKKSITMLRIQGSIDNMSIIESFWMDYCDDGCNWISHPSKINKCKYVYSDCNIATIKLWPTIYAQFIRIRPYKWSKNIALRLEVFANKEYQPQWGRIVTFNTANEEVKSELHAMMSPDLDRKAWQIDCKAVVHAALDNADIISYRTFLASDNKHYVTNFTTANHVISERAMDALAAHGIGREVGVVSAMNLAYRSCASATPSLKEQENSTTETAKLKSKTAELKQKTAGFYRSIKSRDVLQQVIEQVSNSAKLRFDYLAMLIAASLIAVGGLMTNSPVIVVASMLVSPLMGPVLAFTFGITLNGDEFNDLAKMGFRNEMISIFICILVGFFNGLFFILLDTKFTYDISEWPTDEMSSRGTSNGLFSGAYIAAASGIGVGLSVLSEYMSAVVGVAISASLLPPAVNCGMLLSLASAIAFGLSGNDVTSKEAAIQSMWSLLLCLENIAIICIVARLIFWIKNVYVSDDHQNVSIWASINYLKQEYIQKRKSIPIDSIRIKTEKPQSNSYLYGTVSNLIIPSLRDLSNGTALKGIVMRRSLTPIPRGSSIMIDNNNMNIMALPSPTVPLPVISDLQST